MNNSCSFHGVPCTVYTVYKNTKIIIPYFILQILCRLHLETLWYQGKLVDKINSALFVAESVLPQGQRVHYISTRYLCNMED